MNTTIDLIGAALSIISGYFYIKEKSIAWLISLVAIPFDIFMDISIGVYADLLLQFTYLALLIYGWHCWRRGEQDENLPITILSSWKISSLIPIVSIPITTVWFCLTIYTDSNVALLDATVTIISVLAQWLMCRKILQSWLIWSVADGLYIVLYLTKQMPFHMLMSVFDFTMCIIGYICWVKEVRLASTGIQTPVADEDLVYEQT